MKKTMFALAMSLLFALNGNAQQPSHPERSAEDKAERMTERMAENLALTDDQKVAVYEANLKTASIAKEDRKAHFEQYKADLRQVLSDEQFEKWEAMHKERKAGKKRSRSRKY